MATSKKSCRSAGSTLGKRSHNKRKVSKSTASDAGGVLRSCRKGSGKKKKK